MGPTLSVVIPTYNEAANIGPLLAALDGVLSGVDVEYVVVDDDSKDGTARLAAANRRARVIVRKGERGLATAVVRGMREAQGDYVAVMDADFQHPPATVRALLDRARQASADLVIGSRYAHGGSEGNFGAVRKLISRGARAISRLALPPIRKFGLTDPMSGLFLVRRDRLQGVHLRPTGYKILLEVLGRAELRRVEEVGYTFQDRRGGASKLGAGVMVQYLTHVAALGLEHRDNRLLRFMLVGASGVVVNLGAFWLLTALGGIDRHIAFLLGIEASVVSNFLLNDAFTFGDRHDAPWLARISMFHVVSATAIIVQFLAASLLADFLGVPPLLAQAAAIACAFIPNYLGNSRITYGGGRRPQARRWVPILILLVLSSAFYFSTLDEPRGVYFDESYYLAVADQMDNGIWTDPCWAHSDLPGIPLNYEHPPLAKLIMFASIHAYDGYHGVFLGCRLPDDEDAAKHPVPCYTDPHGAVNVTYEDEGLNPGDGFDTGPHCFKAWIHDMKTMGNPYAWRGPGAAFGVLTVVFGALAARRIFQSDMAGTLAGALILADTLILSTARIALLDIFAVGFATMACWSATIPTRRGVVGTFVLLGLGFSCKYYVLFVGPPIALLSLWMHWRAGRLTRRRFDWHWVSALTIPPAVWLATYTPWWILWLRQGPGYALKTFIFTQARAGQWDAAGGDQHHQYQSGPLEWIMMSKPMSYIGPGNPEGPSAKLPHGTVGAYIYAVGNPILWWSASLAVVLVALAFLWGYIASLYRRAVSPLSYFASLPRISQALVVSILLPVFAYFPFYLLQRTTFIFYMSIVVPFFAIVLAGALAYLWAHPRWPAKATVVAVCLLAGLAFVWFFQVSIYMPIPRDGFTWVQAPGTDIYYPALGFNTVMHAVPWMHPFGNQDCWDKAVDAALCT